MSYGPKDANDQKAERQDNSSNVGRLDNVDRVALFKEGSANQQRSGGGGEPSQISFESPYGGKDSPLARMDSNNDKYITRAEEENAYKAIAYGDGVKDVKLAEWQKYYGSEQESMKLFSAMDANGDGKVGHGEWQQHFKGGGFGDYEYWGKREVAAKANEGGGDHGGDHGGGGGGGGGGNGDNFLGQIPPALLKLFDKNGDGVLSPEEATELERVYKLTAKDNKWDVEGLMKAGLSQADAQAVISQMDTNGDGKWDHGGVKQLVKANGGDINVEANSGGGGGGY